MLGALTLGLLVTAGPAVPQIEPRQAAALIAKLGERRPFLGSADAVAEKGSLYLFFKQAEYARLRGNGLLGYWDTGAFKWSGDRIAWDGVVTGAASAKPISARAWRRSFDLATRRRGLVVDPKAPIRFEGSCVGAVVDPSSDEPVPGVVVEVRVSGPSGVLVYRLSLGKPTVEDAIGAAIDVILGFAQRVTG